ncbi:hypothetical protein QZH56_29265 [Streptomyces olivoreticuli]|uniref:hypothetical protein n=1 Tax=Streptomyces olivoreticuli TaxID=68246 RepID=UPI002659441F|nr:hypothetical protein [Streptomyces olivoreticuli]WKK22809.1 hypothetical protein QZH56_29265 [Streptomyces olivoreticuli]
MITASNPWQGHNFAGLLAILIVGAATLLGLIGYLCSRLTRQARRGYTPFRLWRDLSLLTAAAALTVYLWGCLHLLFLEDQELAERCERQRPAGTPTLVGRRGDFIPLRLVCEASNGHDYSIVIPGYINPVVAFLLLLTLTCALASVVLHCKQRTTTRKKG